MNGRRTPRRHGDLPKESMPELSSMVLDTGPHTVPGPGYGGQTPTCDGSSANTEVRSVDVVLWLLLAVVIAIVVVALAYVVRRRRRSGGVVAVGQRRRR
jgi:hypothetical protein